MKAIAEEERNANISYMSVVYDGQTMKCSQVTD